MTEKELRAIEKEAWEKARDFSQDKRSQQAYVCGYLGEKTAEEKGK